MAGTEVNERLLDIAASSRSRLGSRAFKAGGGGPLHPHARRAAWCKPAAGRPGGEIQLTDGIAGLLRREKVFAYRYEGRRYDCGSKEGFSRPMSSWPWRAPAARRVSASTYQA
ncbi:MAG: hypothetical protein U1E77_15205 [Inhella sp.]